ncbi:hypothetical protein GGF50DRAFT_113623 [Schizophyllum commune]
MSANIFDCSVYVTLHNKTKETLYNDPSRTTTSHGDWYDVPATIAAGATAKFRISDRGGWSGSAGTFDFIVRDKDKKERANMYTSEACPWPSGSNSVRYDPPTPQALYSVYFDASVDGGRRTRNWVESGGHPIAVEYTIEYQPKRYRFTLETITAVSAHPVRNSNDSLVVDKHVLWDSHTPDKYKDGTRGSYAPNVFAYDFKSRVSDAGHLDVTVRPLDIELSGAEVILYGSIDGKRVLQTDYFFLKALAPITVQAHVISPATSSKPFAWNSDVDWHMELRLSAQVVEAAGPSTTRLELYWIAQTIHRAFQNGIPVGFLRDVLKKAPPSSADSGVEAGQVAAVFSEFYKDMTRQCFFDWQKMYDTAGGASACGMGFWGGIFYESYYRAADESGVPGTLAKRINCMDQAAMVTLQCSLLGGFASTSWLGQQPFGFIKRTNLVGIRDEVGYLAIVNNPFFGTELRYANVVDDYRDRTYFGCHVYVGHSKPFKKDTDGIYDACGGPHRGEETAVEYVAASIDTGTNLYQVRGIHPGTVDNIQMGDGVTGINGQHYVHAAASNTFVRPMEVFNKLVTVVPSSDASGLSHVNWAHLPSWLTSVLGEDWTLRFDSVNAADGCARAFFHLAAPTPGESIRVIVSVHTVAADGGAVDAERSAAAAVDRVIDILGSTDRDPETLWVRGKLDESGDWSLQYGADVGAGRILIGAGNTVVDFAGMASMAALEEPVRRLLHHVVRRDAPPLRMPVLRSGRLVSSRLVHDATDLRESESVSVQVEGVGTSFVLYFEVDGLLAAAGATCESGALLLDKYTIEQDRFAGEGEAKHAAHFTFVTRELGVHHVRVHVADAETMVTTTHRVEVNVV